MTDVQGGKYKITVYVPLRFVELVVVPLIKAMLPLSL